MIKENERITAGDLEHIAAMLSGATLIAFGASRKSLLGLGLAALGVGLVVRGAQGYKRFLDIFGGERPRSKMDRSILVEKRIYVSKPPEEVYKFWRKLENLPRFFSHLDSVSEIDERLSHWVSNGPAGTVVEWDAEITRDVPNEMIGWQSLEGSDVDNAGSVRFLPGRVGDGTEVRVTLRYNPPGDMLGAAAARIFGADPAKQIETDLRRFKMLIDRDKEGVDGGKGVRRS